MDATTTPPGATRAPVSERALLARINRALTKDRKVVRAARPGTRTRQDFGRFYLLNQRTNCVERWRFDLAALARELGVLAAWEVFGRGADA